MMKIVADNKIPFLKGVLEPYSEVIYLPGGLITGEILKDADALIIRTRTKCNSSLLEGTGVKFIGTATIGYDHIDTRYCDMNNITWTNAPGCNSSSVRQYIAAALLKIAYENSYDLSKMTLGIIGVGNVGSKVESFARTIGMKVLLNDPPRERSEGGKSFTDIETVLNKSDIVTVHVPLNMSGVDMTCHLFDDEMFGKIKKGAWFINSSRGEVAATAALKKALNTGRLSGAVLDVWENEPDIDTELMAGTFISTPHIAGYSTDGKANGTSMVINSLSDRFNLPLKNWYPSNIPDPAYRLIQIDAEGKTAQDVVREAVSLTYDINVDDLNLKSAPASFEKLRGDYRVRREFAAFTVNLKNGSNHVSKILSDLGFMIS